MDRRGFIRGVAASCVMLGFLPRVAHGVSEALDALQRDIGGGSSPGTWERVRREFLLPPDLIHLNCGSTGSTPHVVIDAVAKAMRELEADPVHALYGTMLRAMEDVRRQATAFLGADEDEVAITRNTTEGMNLVASSLRLKPGDEVLTTDHEHPGGMSCWQYRMERDGVRIVQVKMPAPPRDKADILQRLSDAITPRTRVCSVSHVETMTGLRMPAKDIAALMHSKDILLVCDGAQAPGMQVVDVKTLGVDAYASSSHKWMLAPKGSGLLFVRREAQDRIRPIALRAGYGVYSGSVGTRNAPHILGHGLTMDFHNTIGRDRIASRCRELSNRLRARIREIPGVRVLTPDDPELSSAIFSVALGKGRSSDVAKRMRERHRIVAKVVPSTLIVDPALASENYNALRFSTHIFNSETDIDRAADVLAEVAG